MKKISKKTKIKILTFILAALSAFIVFALMSYAKSAKYERITEAVYEQNLMSAAEYSADLTEVLTKGLYSTSEKALRAMCADIRTDCYEIKQALSALPVSEIDNEKSYAFFSKTAEYARSLENKIAREKTLSEEDRKTLLPLREHIKKLSENLERLQNIYVNSDKKIVNDFNFTFDPPELFSTRSVGGKLLSGASDDLADIPKLVYDGPYSDSSYRKEPQALKGLKAISEPAAFKKAEKLLKDFDGDIKTLDKVNGTLPMYTFEKGRKTLCLSVAGGIPVSLTCSEKGERQAVSKEKCIDEAGRYLNSLGFKNMVCNYYEIKDGVLSASFNYADGKVQCYTDLIKVNINIESGKVCGFDAATYLLNHKKRNIPSPAVSSEKARESVSKYLEIKAEKLALIPTPSGTERFCREYLCKAKDGTSLLVFIDARTGEQADILILQINENGVIAIN